MGTMATTSNAASRASPKREMMRISASFRRPIVNLIGYQFAFCYVAPTDRRPVGVPSRAIRQHMLSTQYLFLSRG